MIMPTGGRVQFKMFSQPTKLLYSQMALTVPSTPEIMTIGRFLIFVMLESPSPAV